MKFWSLPEPDPEAEPPDDDSDPESPSPSSSFNGIAQPNLKNNDDKLTPGYLLMN